jgi:hypothetical protein
MMWTCNVLFGIFCARWIFAVDEVVTKPSYFPLKLPASIKRAAERLAREDGVSLNQRISSAVAQKIGAVETAAVFLKARAGEARPSDITAFLKRARDEPPAASDEMM